MGNKNEKGGSKDKLVCVIKKLRREHRREAVRETESEIRGLQNEGREDFRAAYRSLRDYEKKRGEKSINC